MRFVWAVAAFVLAALMIGAGIAQRTVFQGPKTETASISVEEDAPYLLIDGAVLNQLPAAKLRAQGDGDIFAAYGRTADMEAWLSDTAYNAVAVDDEGEIVDDDGRAGARRRGRRHASDRTTRTPAAATTRRRRGRAARAQPDRLRPVARRVPADGHPHRPPLSFPPT